MSDPKDQRTLQAKFDEEDRQAFEAIAHIPDEKLRENLAVQVAESTKIEELLDDFEGMEPGMSSMETTESRVEAVIKIAKQSSQALKKAHVALRKWQAWTHLTPIDQYPKDCREATDAALRGAPERKK